MVPPTGSNAICHLGQGCGDGTCRVCWSVGVAPGVAGARWFRSAYAARSPPAIGGVWGWIMGVAAAVEAVRMDRDVEALQWLTDAELVAARREAIRDVNLCAWIGRVRWKMSWRCGSW